MSFDTPAQAVAAWLDLDKRIEAFNTAPRCPFRVAFAAGMAVGDIRVFRSAMFGAPFYSASLCCAYGPRNTLTYLGATFVKRLRL